MLKNRLKMQGELLFRWRGFLPLILLPGALIAAAETRYFETLPNYTIADFWEIACVLISLSGLALRAATVGFAPHGTSGRNTRTQRADTLNTTGMYSIVRNPLYLGNYLILLGFSLIPGAWWFVILASLCFALYYERIIYAEEAFLQEKFGSAYTEWAERTPIFFPALKKWQKPALPFSFRNVLRREYNGFYVIVVVVTAFEMANDVLGAQTPLALWIQDDAARLIFFVIGTLMYLSLRTLKRHTHLLTVPGR